MRKFKLAFTSIQNGQINPSNPDNGGNDNSNKEENLDNESIVNSNIISYKVSLDPDHYLDETCIGTYSIDITNLDLNNKDVFYILGDSQWCEVMYANGNTKPKKYDSLTKDEKNNICSEIETPRFIWRRDTEGDDTWFLDAIQGYNVAQAKGSITDFNNLDKLDWNGSNLSIVKTFLK
jgi:hypothetical protein